MKTSLLRLAAAALCLAVFLPGPRPACAAATVVLNVSLGDPESAEMGVVGNSFRQYLQEKSKGAVEVRLFYGSVLGEDESVQFHKVQTGKLDMALGGIGNLVPMCPKLSVLTLPYLFDNFEQALQGTTGAAAAMLDGYAREVGLRILAWTYSGFRFITNDKRPIECLEDIRGLRFRVPFSIAMLQTYRSFGAIPSSLPWGVTYQALEQDLVDGQCCSYPMFRSMRFMEAGQKYLTEIHYTYLLQPLVIGERLFASLAPELQQLVLEAGRYAQEQSSRYQDVMSAIAKHDLMAKGLVVSRLRDEEKWEERALQTVWPDVAGIMGGVEAINAYLKASGLPEWVTARP